MDDNFRRWMLFMLVALLVFQFAYLMPANKRQQEEKARQQAAEKALATPAAEDGATTQTATRAVESAEVTPEEPAEKITIDTKVYRVTFTTAGAYPVSWQITDPRYAKVTQADVDEAEALGYERLKVGAPMPIELIPQYQNLGANRDYPFQVILKESGGEFFRAFNQRVYEVDQRTDSDGTKEVRFTSPVTKEGLRLTKIYRFSPGGYLASLRMELQNSGGQGQRFSFAEPNYPGLGVMWGPGIAKVSDIDRGSLGSYAVAAYRNDEVISVKPSWQDALKGDVVDENIQGNLQWGLVESRFYVAAIIPQGTQKPSLIRATVKPHNIPQDGKDPKHLAPPYTLEVYSNGFQLAPGESRVFDYSLFIGPKQRSLLTEVDEKHDFNLQAIMFSGSMWLTRVLANFMLGMLNWLHEMTRNYGVAIILLTIIMRLITHPFTHIGMKHQARVQAEMKRVKPLIDSVNEKYKEDPQKRQAETWKIYKEHGVNPLGMFKGCIWMLIQLPIFIALYVLLSNAIDLKGASFLWVKDLTAQDALFTLPFSIPFLGNKLNLIPILMGATQVVAMRLQAVNITDPTQRQMNTLMPIIFTFMFYKFPAGLSLYWFVSNIWQILLQIFVNKRVQQEAEHRAHRVFEERQAARAAGIPDKKQKSGPTWQERMMEYVEKKTKEAEQKRKK